MARETQAGRVRRRGLAAGRCADVQRDAESRDAIRSIGVTEATYYRWRNEYGGLKSDQVKR